MNGKTLIPSAVALLLLGCNPWDNLPLDGWSWLEDPLWDDEVVAATDGLYVRLPHAGALMRITTAGETSTVDLGDAEPVSMALGPDLDTIVLFQQWDDCDTDDPDVETLSDCPEDDLVTHHELSLIRDGQVVGENGPVDVPGHYNRLEFSPWSEDSGTDPVAVAYLDYEGGGIDVEGVLNLTEVLFVNLRTGATAPVSVGFSANNVLFTADGTKAAVLSRSQVVVVDLTSADYDVLVTYHLTLDADQEVDPLGAAITPDDRYLLMSVENSGDLYAMDLDNESINIVDLDASPAAMAVDSYADRTALVYGSRAQVDLLEHDYFDVETVELDEPCNAIAETDAGFAVLYNESASTHDVYLLDIETGDLTEYRLANPVMSLQLTEDQTYAVALLRQEWDDSSSGIDAEYDEHWGMSLIDLTDDDNIDLMLGSQPVGLALAEDAAGEPFATEEIALPAPPTGIGAMPDGLFYITHQASLGLVSFLEPGAQKLTRSVSGFAGEGLFTDDELPEGSEGGE